MVSPANLGYLLQRKHERFPHGHRLRERHAARLLRRHGHYPPSVPEAPGARIEIGSGGGTPRAASYTVHAKTTTLCLMATLTIRIDSEVERALAALVDEGKSRSEVVREAILEAERSLRRARLRAEAESLMSDPDDVAESKALTAEMDAIRAR